MGGAMIEALWRAQSDEADAGRSSAEDERKSSGGSAGRGAENLARTDKNASRRECEKEAKFEILACARSKNETLRQRFGVKIAASETDLAREADAVVLATKPASYEAILRLIAPDLARKILLLLAPNFDIKRARQIVGEDVYELVVGNDFKASDEAQTGGVYTLTPGQVTGAIWADSAAVREALAGKAVKIGTLKKAAK